MSDYNELPTEPSGVPVTTVIRYYARKTAKVAIIATAAVGAVVLVQRFRNSEDETGGAETVA